MTGGNIYQQKANNKNRKRGFFPLAMLLCSLLFANKSAISQTYNNVTHLSGTNTVGGVGVTVTSAGVVGSSFCSGISQPYLEGHDPVGGIFGTGSYTWSFSVPVNAIRIYMESIDAGDDVTILINGTPYFLTAANVTPLAPGSTCTGSAGTATTAAGTLVNAGGGSNSATLDIMPGVGITSVTIQSLAGGNGVLNNFSFTQNTDPTFINGGIELFTICESSGSNNISSMLSVMDADMGQTLTWSIAGGPAHGTATGFPATATSTGDTVTPSGLGYTPTAGFSGFDTLIVQVTDGATTMLDTLVITVNPKPTLSSSLVLPSICTGQLLSYSPTSAIAGTTFNWNRPFIGGIANPAATGTGNPNEVLTNLTYYNVTVTYIYTLVANGCSNTQNVTVLVKPTPSITSPLRDTLCSGDAVGYTLTTGTLGGTFTWTRASVPGITPATGSGSGSVINEMLVNGTSAPIDVAYVVTMDAGGCATTQTVTITVTPPVAGIPITTMPPSSLCDGTMYQNFGTSTPHGIGVTYSWSATNATVDAVGNGGQYALVSFANAGPAVVTLYSGVPGSACVTSSSYNVNVSVGENPSGAVIYYNYQFIYLDNTADTYQWGYDDATTLDSSRIAGAGFQSYPNANPDFTNKHYWIIASKNGCIQKTYYNAPAGAVGVRNVQRGNLNMDIFPNPASNKVTINVAAQQGSMTLMLTDMMGQTVKTISGTGHDMQIDVADMPAGCYLVSCVQDGVRIATGRFIKN